MDVHGKLRIAVGIGRCVDSYAAGGAAKLTHENLALAGRQVRRLVYERVEEPVAELEEIVRLPVIVGTGREQRVERGLPGREGLHADHVGDWISERAQWFQGAVALVLLSRVADGERDDLLAVDLGRQERQR